MSNIKNKLAKFNFVDSNICAACNVISNTEHPLFHCKFPKYSSIALTLFLDKYCYEGRPHFIFLKENVCLNNIFYNELSHDEYIQLTQLVPISKEKALKYSSNGCIKQCKYYNFFLQSILITQFACKSIEYLGRDSSFLKYLLNFL